MSKASSSSFIPVAHGTPGVADQTPLEEDEFAVGYDLEETKKADASVEDSSIDDDIEPLPLIDEPTVRVDYQQQSYKTFVFVGEYLGHY